MYVKLCLPESDRDKQAEKLYALLNQAFPNQEWEFHVDEPDADDREIHMFSPATRAKMGGK